MSRKGFTLTELTLAMALVGITLAIALPAFSNVMRSARLNGAVRQLVSDVREVRSQAVATGWDYRIVGYRDAEASFSNQYRVVARRSSASWPSDSAAPFRSDTQIAERWIDLASFHPGVTFSSSDPRFQVTFDSRGVSTDAATSFNPLQMIGADGESRSLNVSLIGRVTSE